MIFKPNPLLVLELEAEAIYAEMLKGRAEDAKREAEAVAPMHTGYYKEHFVLVKSGKNWRLGNRDPFAHLVEWGSSRNSAFSPLRRGVVAAGLHLREAPKP
jgi:hypothetical protein